jgi:predicted protein tyrosine phosphatase
MMSLTKIDFFKIKGNKMGFGIHSNSYQGDYKRVLTVCSANMLRSPTMAHVLASAPYDYNTRSAGTAHFALIPVTDDLLFWADEIVCADTEHATTINAKLMSLNLDKPIIDLRIPDNYEYRNPELIMIIQKRYDSILLSSQ